MTDAWTRWFYRACGVALAGIGVVGLALQHDFAHVVVYLGEIVLGLIFFTLPHSRDLLYRRGWADSRAELWLSFMEAHEREMPLGAWVTAEQERELMRYLEWKLVTRK